MAKLPLPRRQDFYYWSHITLMERQISMRVGNLLPQPTRDVLSTGAQARGAACTGDVTTVVVTRPASLAGSWCARFHALGLRVARFPLLDIAPARNLSLLDRVARKLGSYTVVIFASPSAVAMFMPHVGRWPRHVRIAVVGEGIRRKLAEFGIHPGNADMICPPPGDVPESESLLRHPAFRALRTGRALVVRGECGREGVSAALSAQGLLVECLPVYRHPPPLDDCRAAALLQLLARRNDWIITCAHSLHVFTEQARAVAGPSGVASARKQRLIVTHPSIAAAAREAGFLELAAASPSEGAIVACLRSLHGRVADRTGRQPQ